MPKLTNASIIRFFLALLGLLSDVVILLFSIINGESLNIPQILMLFFALYLIFVLAGLSSGREFLLMSHFWFVSFFMVYQTVYPIIIYYGKILYFGVQLYSVSYTLLFALKFFCVVLLSFYFMLLFKKNKFNGLEFIALDYNDSGGLVIVAFFNLVVELISFVQSGLLAFILSGSKSRSDINNYISTTNIWGYVGYINIYLFVLFVIQYKVYKSKRGLLLVFFNISYYIVVSIITGSRKFVLWMFMICLIFYFARIFISKIPIIIGGLIALISTYQRIVVFDGGLYGDFFRRLAGALGEFIFTTITFPLSYQMGVDRHMFNYPTYFDSLLYFIPRAVFPLKNYSIAKVFMNYMDVGMGFASNPMLEGYVNCGNVGWLIEGVIISILLSIIMKFQKKNFYLFVFSIIFLVDLNRGEVSYFLRQIIEVGITIQIANKLCKKLKI